MRRDSERAWSMTAIPTTYRFEVRVHHKPTGLAAGTDWDEDGQAWPTLRVPSSLQAEPMAISFDEALARMEQIHGCAMEPDGALLWAGEGDGRRWQIDGNLYDLGGRVVFLQLTGTCPSVAFDALLECLGWPNEPVMMELVRASVFLDEGVFRRHAAERAGRP
jgi:hypothetical protein